MMNLETTALFLPGLVLGITVHEFAHAFVAGLLGDDYPRRLGRVSLNPLRHLSPLGTLAILLLPFGWGKPVEINLYNFKHPKWDFLLSSLAGPFANVITAGVCILLMFVTRHDHLLGPQAAGAVAWTHHMLAMAVLVNAIMAVLNLLPIPPLDGSRIWLWASSSVSARSGQKLQRISTIVLVVLFVSGHLDMIITPAVRGVISILPRLDSVVKIEATMEKAAQKVAEASAALEAKRYADAEALATAAIEMELLNTDAHHCRALARMGLGNNSGALEDLNMVIVLAPSRTLYRDRAEVLRRLNQPAEAIEDELEAAALPLSTMPTMPAGGIPGK